MNTPPRYSIIKQFQVEIAGKVETVSRLHGARWHCTCPDCNLGYCDRECLHVNMAIQDGIEVEPVITAIAKARWKTEGRKEALNLAKVLPWETAGRKFKKEKTKKSNKVEKPSCPPSPARGPVLGNFYR